MLALITLASACLVIGMTMALGEVGYELHAASQLRTDGRDWTRTRIDAYLETLEAIESVQSLRRRSQ
jgi:hypothetical protein